MRAFAASLRAQGHRVHYLQIGAKDNHPRLTDNLDALIAHFHARRLCWQLPDEYRLDRQLHEYAAQLKIETEVVDSEHFYTPRLAVGEFFADRKQWLMESFYRHMRQQHGILLDMGGQPEGGKWNYDHDNRKAWQGKPAVPDDRRPSHDHSRLWREIQDAGVRSFGEAHNGQLSWPVSRQEALQHLEHFINEYLPEFGQFQDAMSSNQWYLFHSLLSFAMNSKMLAPREVVDRVEQAYRDGDVPLASAEGFIRQILGWREYVRGVYWSQMPGYTELNVLQQRHQLPHYFWDGDTKMNCMAHALGQSLERAYAHHIQRLMIIGNFALLAGIAANEVHQWYLGVYIDAFEWVEAPNTLGMSQYADGGLMASKPYVSTAAYIDRMSDYCGGCHYRRKQRHGPGACPFNSLYWDFFARQRSRLAGNHRLSMVYRQWEKMSADERDAIAAYAADLRKNLNSL